MELQQQLSAKRAELAGAKSPTEAQLKASRDVVHNHEERTARLVLQQLAVQAERKRHVILAAQLRREGAWARR